MATIDNSSVGKAKSSPAQNKFLVKEETKDKLKSATLTDITSKCSDSFPCHICGKYFAHRSSLFRHKKSVHPQLQSGSICCQEKTAHFRVELCKNSECI